MSSNNDSHDSRTNSPSAVASITENTKQWFIAAIMALSIAMNIGLAIVLSYEYKAEEQKLDLKKYDIDFFKQNDWADLKTRVEIDHELIQAYGLQKAVKEK